VGYEKNEAKESGMSVKDVIEYVRRRMYLKNVVKLESDDEEDKRKVIELLEESSAKEDNKEESSDDNIPTPTRMSNWSNKVDITTDVAKGKATKSSIDDGENSNSTPQKSNGSNDDTESDDDDDDNNHDGSGDVDYEEEEEEDDDDDDDDGDDDEYNDDKVVQKRDVDDEDEFVPDDCIFPSYFCFVLWGPFVEKEKQLTLFLPDDAPKSCVKTQAQKRKERRQKRNLERMKDTSAIRGFSTDQQITIESINVNKQTLKHLQDETQMVAFGLQESAIRAQLSQVQSMAERQCPKYDENNMFWQRVDSLQKRHGESIQTLMNLTKEKKKHLRMMQMLIQVISFFKSLQWKNVVTMIWLMTMKTML
jgi:hypothetical protein